MPPSDAGEASSSALEEIYHHHQDRHRIPVGGEELQQDVVNITVAEDGRASFSLPSGTDSISSSSAAATLASIRHAAEQRASTALSRLTALSRAELETKVLELEAIVKTQRFEVEQLRSEVRIQRGMRTRGEQRQNDLHRLELKRLAEDTESEMKIAMMETSRHPAEMLLEQRLMDVVQFQKKKSGGGGGGGERKTTRKDIAKLKRDVLAKGRATGQIERGREEEAAEEGAFIERLTAPVGPGGLPSPPSTRGRKWFVMPSDADGVEHRDPPRDDDAFMEYIEGFQRKTSAMAEGLL